MCMQGLAHVWHRVKFNESSLVIKNMTPSLSPPCPTTGTIYLFALGIELSTLCLLLESNETCLAGGGTTGLDRCSFPALGRQGTVWEADFRKSWGRSTSRILMLETGQESLCSRDAVLRPGLNGLQLLENFLELFPEALLKKTLAS